MSVPSKPTFCKNQQLSCICTICCYLHLSSILVLFFVLFAIQSAIMLLTTTLFISLLIKQCLCEALVFETSVEYQKIPHDVENGIIMQPAGIRGNISGDVMVNISTAEPLNYVEESFISFNMDSAVFGRDKLMLNTRSLFALFFLLPTSTLSVGMGRMFESICLLSPATRW